MSCPVSGYGSFTFPKFSNQNGKYTGEWANSKPHGRGKMEFTDGGVYEGNFSNGLKEGTGVQRWGSGEYAGDSFLGSGLGAKAQSISFLMGGFIDKTGFYRHANGDSYDGEWKNDKKEGKGVLTHADGSSYDGDFSNGMMEGTGVFRWADGKSYVGSFKNDLREGKGVFTYADGDSYDGEWKNNMREGKGVFTCAVDGKTSVPGLSTTWNAGDVCDCVWKENRRHGACRYTFFNGEVYACTFVDGVCAEFDARQAAVCSAPDAASVQARAEGHASAAAKAEAEAAERAKFSHVTDILQRLGLALFLPAFMKEDVSNDVLATLTVDELKGIGLTLGNAKKVRLEIDALASPALAAGGGGGGGGDIIAALKERVAQHDPAKWPPSMWDMHRELKAILQQLESEPAFSSNFSKFDGYYSATPLPKFADELLAAVRKTIFKYSSKHDAEQAAAEHFFKYLQAEAFTHAKDLSESISVSAGLIWTSQLRLTMRDGSTTEFCGVLNRILRDADDDLLPDACVVVRAVNSMCVLRHDPSKLMYPAGGMTYRGGGMPLHLVLQLPGQPPPFFVADQKYRVPMFLATSDKRDVAENFMVMAAARGDPPVVWSIKVDPRGAAQLLYRCKHVNQVPKSNVPGEFEFLYAPYSVFTVESVTLPPAGAAPSPACPILIVIVAALDNKEEPHDLPLAPWA